MDNRQEPNPTAWAVMIYPADEPGRITYAHPGLTIRQVAELLSEIVKDCERALAGLNNGRTAD